MKKHLLLILTLTLLFFKSYAQKEIFNKNVNKDSLLKASIKDMPAELQKQFMDEYNSGNETSKDFLLFMISMPRSSKADLIKNIDVNYDKIALLVTEFKKLVPAGFTVLIEFNPENKLISAKEGRASIDMRVSQNRNGERILKQDWNLQKGSESLRAMMAVLNWNEETLTKIKTLLDNAHCVSIANDDETVIGFARSGMGKYSYLLFDHNLSADEIKKYNNGCDHIFYKQNIVLQYGGGAVGPQCFPDN